jgi:AcrR family transcriptional regulator
MIAGYARGASLSESHPQRRRYDSLLRRQRASETWDRIVSAGSELVHGGPVWDWRGITFQAVAERAGVNERTVYRHFPNERSLRDAVMQRLQEEAGIRTLEGMTLEDITDVTERTLAYVSTFPSGEPVPQDATQLEMDKNRREALLNALAPATEDWPEADRAVVAAMFDVLWGIGAFERLVKIWGLDPAQATGGITWVMRLIEAAIREGQRPGAQ